MTQPDYPLLVLPGYEMYQLAHIATYLADGLARHRSATSDAGRAAAARDVAAGRAALERFQPDGALPSALDGPTFQAARNFATGTRWAEIVSVAPRGQPGWAVIGFVPGIGPVGARAATHTVAQAVHQHLLAQPAHELVPWAITDRVHLPPNLPASPDLAAVVAGLDPRRDRDRAVARNLTGRDPRVDAVIGRRFAGTDLDAPLVVKPPAAAEAGSSREMCGMGRQVTSAPRVAATSAGPKGTTSSRPPRPAAAQQPAAVSRTSRSQKATPR